MKLYQSYQIKVLGIEITESTLYLAQLTGNQDRVVVDNMVSAPTAPKAILSGKIIDSETLAGQIRHLIKDNGFETYEAIVGLNDPTFIKHVSLFPKEKEEDLRLVVANQLAPLRYVLEDEIHVGIRSSMAEDDFGPRAPLLYAAITRSHVHSLIELAEQAELDLLAVDLPILAAYRCQTWKGGYADEPVLFVYMDKTYIDLMIWYQDNPLMTRTFRYGFEDIDENPALLDGLVHRIQNILLAAQNIQPDVANMTKMVLSSRFRKALKLEPAIRMAFPEYSVIRFNILNAVHFNTKKIKSKQLLENAREFAPAIGLGLHYFQKDAKPLSFVKSRRRLEPVVNRLQLAICLALCVIIAGIGVGVRTLVDHQVEKTKSKIVTTQEDIKGLETGNYILQKQELKALQTQIDRLDEYRKGFPSRSNIIRQLTLEMPDDIVYSRLDISQTSDISVRGSAYYSKSIYGLYQLLTTRFEHVTLPNVAITPSPEGAEVSEFVIEAGPPK